MTRLRFKARKTDIPLKTAFSLIALFRIIIVTGLFSYIL